MNRIIFNNIPVIFLKDKTFPLLRKIEIENFAKNFFNQSPYHLDDILFNINDIKINHDKKYYKRVLIDYFKSENLVNKNFKDNFVKKFNSLA